MLVALAEHHNSLHRKGKLRRESDISCIDKSVCMEMDDKSGDKNVATGVSSLNGGEGKRKCSSAKKVLGDESGAKGGGEKKEEDSSTTRGSLELDRVPGFKLAVVSGDGVTHLFDVGLHDPPDVAEYPQKAFAVL